MIGNMGPGCYIRIYWIFGFSLKRFEMLVSMICIVQLHIISSIQNNINCVHKYNYISAIHADDAMIFLHLL